MNSKQRNNAMAEVFKKLYGEDPAKSGKVLDEFMAVYQTADGFASLFHEAFKEVSPQVGGDIPAVNQKRWGSIRGDDPYRLAMVGAVMVVVTRLGLQDEVTEAVRKAMTTPHLTCDHEWFEFENENVTGTLICPKCKSFKGVGEDDRHLIQIPSLQLRPEIEEGVRVGNLDVVMAPSKRYVPDIHTKVATGQKIFDASYDPEDPYGSVGGVETIRNIHETGGRFFEWLKEVGQIMGKDTEQTADLIEDQSWFGCYDDGMKPIDAVRKFYQHYPRNAAEVIDRILSEVPGIPAKLRVRLSALRDKAPFKAPEQQQDFWGEFTSVIGVECEYPPKEPWELAIYKIMTLEDYKEPDDVATK